MGGSTAFNLMRSDPKLKVAVVEKDPTYEFASSTLSMANVRTQFSLKENILISQYALGVLDNFGPEMAVEGEEPDISFRHEGNLFLYDQAGRPGAEAGLALQRSLGCEAEWWGLDRIRERFPLYLAGEEVEGIVGGVWGPQDGHLDAYAVVQGFKSKARSLGAEFIKGEAVRVLAQAGRVEGIELDSGEKLKSGVVVNCAGAWAAKLAATAGVELPIDPTKRQVFALDTTVKPEGPLPLTILPSGFYFRTETGDLILMGWSLEEDEVGFSFTWDRDRFMDLMWPKLASIVPAFDQAKLVRGWAGLYAVNTLDGNAILGQWPELKGFYLANGFSGHGLQQSPAVGRYISELILGRSPSLDLSIFDPARILEDRPIGESGLV
ncbi:MAG: FAD-binding oxidoreductase [Chlorobiales bacterium]|nr:FAD-binding oxidoreductase [Chlorobiales bacterium]